MYQYIFLLKINSRKIVDFYRGIFFDSENLLYHTVNCKVPSSQIPADTQANMMLFLFLLSNAIYTYTYEYTYMDIN